MQNFCRRREVISQASCQYYIYIHAYTCANDCTFLYQQMYFLPSIKCKPERNKDHSITIVLIMASSPVKNL